MSVNSTRNSINSFLHNAFVQGSINKKYGKSAAIAVSAVTYTAIAALSYVVATYALAYQTNAVFLSMLVSPEKFTVGSGVSLTVITMIYFGIKQSKTDKLRENIHQGDELRWRDLETSKELESIEMISANKASTAERAGIRRNRRIKETLARSNAAWEHKQTSA